MTGSRGLVFISDVHSNLEALNAVLDKIGEAETYCLGDIVGYGASPNEVIASLRRRKVTCILGNHDYAVLAGKAEEFTSRAMQAVIWTLKNLSEESRSFLVSLPLNRTISLGHKRVFMTHGSPDDNLWEYVFPFSHSDMFEYYLEKLGVDAIALGHTHVPFAWDGKRGLVFNPGSVGQPRNGDRRASYALLRTSRGRLVVDHKSVEYDVEGAAAKILAAGLPPTLATRLFTGD